MEGFFDLALGFGLADGSAVATSAERVIEFG
jgi:hypothetical protein